jgi:hypothetical protein
VKDFFWFGLLLLLLTLTQLADDYRAERCHAHGGKWVERPGCCDSDGCVYPAAKGEKK